MLNERQKAFCEYYASSFNATESANKAGYSKKTARSIGQRLLTNVDIKSYIEELTRKPKQSRIATIDEVLSYLSNTMRNTEEQTRERTKAAQLLSEVLAKVKPQEDETPTAVVVEFEDASGDNEDEGDN